MYIYVYRHIHVYICTFFIHTHVCVYNISLTSCLLFILPNVFHYVPALFTWKQLFKCNDMVRALT